MLKANITPYNEFCEMYKASNNIQVPLLKRIFGVEQKQLSGQEELANILVAIFGRKTSVVYDMSSICELFDSNPQDRELLANVMMLGLV
jgi:ligand-binding sensor protein